MLINIHSFIQPVEDLSVGLIVDSVPEWYVDSIILSSAYAAVLHGPTSYASRKLPYNESWQHHHHISSGQAI